MMGKRTTSIPKISKSGKSKKAFRVNKKDVIYLNKYDYGHEVIIDSNVSSQTSRACDTIPIEAGKVFPKKPKIPPATNKTNVVADQGAHGNNLEETPDLLLDQWDIYLQKEYPKEYKKNFKS